MTLHDKMKKIEDKAKKRASPKRNDEKSLNKQVVKEISELKESNKKIAELIQDIKTTTQNVHVENFDNSTKDVKVKNWPKFPDKVTIKNPQVEIKNWPKFPDEVSIKNEKIEIKNWPKQKEFPTKEIVSGINESINNLPESIASQVKQVTQPVIVTNNTLDVFVLDPKTLKRIHPGGGSYAGVGGGGNVITDIRDGTGDSVMDSDNNAVRTTISGNVTVTPGVTGGGTEADAQRVTIANDSTGLLSVDDNGGSLTVDNAGLTELAAAINGSQVDVDLKASDLDLMLGTDFSSVFGTASLISGTPAVKVEEQGTVTVDLGANNDVTIDNSSIVHAEDSAHSSGHDGIMPLAVRNDTLGALAGTDGDYAPFQINASGALYIQEGSALDVSAATVTTTPAVTGGGTETAAQRVTIANDSTGVLSVDDNNGSLTVDNGGTFAVQEDGAALTALQLIDDIIFTDDSSFTTSSNKVAAIGAIRDDIGTDAVDEGDIGAVRMTAKRELNTVIKDAAGNDRGANVNASNEVLVKHADAIPVTDNSGSLTVDSSDLATIAGAVSGSQMQVDIVADGADLLTNTTFNAAFGTAGSADTQVMSVQGIASMTPILADVTGQGDVPITLDGESVTVTATQLDVDDLNAADDEVAVGADAGVTGLSTVFDSDGDNTAQQIKASAGRLYALEISNPNSSDAYVQLFDLATGSVTVGMTTPKQSYFVPAGDGTKDGARDLYLTIPIGFDTAITYACTTTATGSGDPAVGLICNFLFK